MNKTKWMHSWVLFGVLAFLVLSCNIAGIDFDNIEDPTFTPVVVAPIGEVTYTIKELIEEINDPSIEIDQAKNQFITIIYRDTSIYNTPQELINVPDISEQKVVEHSLSITNSPVAVNESFSTIISFEYSAENLEQIDSIMYSSGELLLEFNSQIKADVELEVRMIDFENIETRDTIVLNYNLPYNGSSAVSGSQTQDLSGYRTKLRMENDLNLFDVEVNATISLKAGQSIAPTDFILATLSTTNTSFSAVIGYFGEDDIVVQDQSIDIEFFKDIEPNGLEFREPEIIVNFQNSFGVPIGITLDGLATSNDQGDVRILSGDVVLNTQKMRAPGVSDFGETLGSSFSISPENSNISELLAISPTNITLPITATTNFENTDQEANFYTDVSQVETIVEVRMPLEVKLDGYTQTFDFELDSIDFNDADSVTLRVTTVNQLPFNGTFDLYLLDADSIVLHQVPDNLVLQSPELESSSKVEEAITSVEDVTLNADGIVAMNNTSKVVFVLNVESFDAASGDFVRIYSDYTLVIKLGAIINLNYTLD
ncbi:MAG: hypothetical protein JXQ96_04205 [Cyclobacteriaceae bacterium]